ncbi:MAG: Sel1 repeat protein [Chlamydiales bacterium]|jgi:TPR repeat protein|nr:Sel1 repeat protein [Chlamydiales bacterium]
MYVSRAFQKVEDMYSNIKASPLKTFGVGVVAGFVTSKVSSLATSILALGQTAYISLAAAGGYLIGRISAPSSPSNHISKQQQQQTASSEALSEVDSSAHAENHSHSSSQIQNEVDSSAHLENKNSCQSNTSNKNTTNIKIPASALPSYKLESNNRICVESIKTNSPTIYCGPQYHNYITEGALQSRIDELLKKAQGLQKLTEPKSLKKSVKCYQKAADLGSTLALKELAICYKFGKGVEKNTQVAFELYLRAYRLGDLNSTFHLAVCYQTGEGVAQNDFEASILFKEIARRGDAASLTRLALFYQGQIEQGHFLPGINEALVFRLFCLAAKEGDPEALLNLGFCYEKGLGVSLDLFKASECYRAVEKQLQEKIEPSLENKENSSLYKEILAIAYLMLGDCYLYGKGVDGDQKKAFLLYQKASESGIRKAKFVLGFCYQKGIGTEPSPEKAFECYASDLNFLEELEPNDSRKVEAQYFLEQCYQEGFGAK